MTVAASNCAPATANGIRPPWSACEACFGRGLLFLAGDAEEPKDRENFLLRFPPKRNLLTCDSIPA